MLANRLLFFSNTTGHSGYGAYFGFNRNTVNTTQSILNMAHLHQTTPTSTNVAHTIYSFNIASKWITAAGLPVAALSMQDSHFGTLTDSSGRTYTWKPISGVAQSFAQWKNTGLAY